MLKNMNLVYLFFIYFVAYQSCVKASVSLEKREEVCKIDLVILVDHSGSIVDPNMGNDENDWEQVKSFLLKIVDSYEIGEDKTQISLLTFSTGIQVKFNFGTTKDEMKNAIRDLPIPDGFTATAAALQKAQELLASGRRQDANSAVLLMTDGLPTQNLAKERINDQDTGVDEKRKEFIEEAIKQAQVLRASTGAKVLALGITDQVNQEGMGGHTFLEKVADKPEYYYKAEDFDSLQQHIQQIRSESCKIVESVCDLDIAFAVDMSGSVDEKAVKNFMVRLTEELYKMDERMHTALIRFANKAKVFKYLDQYDPEIMKNEIKSMGSGGYTATPWALQLAFNQVFVAGEGDRADAYNVLVIISDGMPTVDLDGTKINTNSPQANRETEQMAKNLRSQKGVYIISVVVEGQEGENLGLLGDISSTGKALTVSDFDQLMGTIGELKNQICQAAPKALRGLEMKSDEKDDRRALLEELLELLKRENDSNMNMLAAGSVNGQAGITKRGRGERNADAKYNNIDW